MHDRAKQLIESGDKLFSDRLPLMSFWQTVGENFYPERADFTVCHTLGEDFADGLMSSYPLIVRRELGNSFSSMLRPKDQPWFEITVDREERLDHAGRAWLEFATEVQKRAMYDRVTQFVRATKEGDHDFAAFGQCVISRDINHENTALLYQCWHIRDVVWRDDPDGSMCEIHRKWKPTVRTLARKFGKASLHQNVAKLIDSQPYAEIECRHVVIKSGDYEGQWGNKPYVSVFIDVQNRHVMFERGVYSQIYTIPRWQTVSGSQYAYSPAVVAGLPDARLLQAMTLTILEAGETAVRPPLIATQDALSSGINNYAGGVTAVDAAYDERMGDSVRELYKNPGKGLPFGLEVSDQKQQMLATAFYLNKLTLPAPDHEMTAFETSQRIQEYIRQALPLFEPMETEYNGALCEGTFDDLMRVNAFGAYRDIPQSIRGANVRFKFESPLHDAIERQKGQKFIEAKSLLLQAAELDPASVATLDARVALRDALSGIRTPMKWLRNEEAVEAHAAQLAQQQQIQQVAGMVQQAAETGEQIGKAEQANAAA